MRLNIGSKLFFYFIILTALPTSIISLTIYNRSTEIINRNIETSIAEKLNIIVANITQKLDSVNHIADEIYLDKDTIRILSSQHPTDASEIISEMSVFDKLLSNYTVTDTTINLLVPKIYLFNRPEYLLYGFTEKVSDLSKIENEKWYRNLPPRTKYTIVGLGEEKLPFGHVQTIKVAKRLFGLDDMRIQFSGVLTFDIGVDYFRTLMNQSKPTAGSAAYIIDSGQSIVVSSDEAMDSGTVSSHVDLERIQSQVKPSGSFIGKNDTMVTYDKMNALGWTIVTTTPIREMRTELDNLNRRIYLVIGICGIAALIIALWLSLNISKPIRKLVASMRKVQGGNFEITTMEHNRKDELGYLMNSYKRMVQELKELIDKLYVSEIKEKEAELKSLQAQINPHFLYNTLDSINWMALELKSTPISQMVTSLSDFFRYSLNNGRNIIQLREEASQVESYLTIQKIRFQERLDYSLAFDSSMMDCFSPKLILQPLVENAIVHGINKKRGKGFIAIKGVLLDGMIEITIEDNGAGADVEWLSSMLEEPSTMDSFGLKNVNERIRRYFGDAADYGMKFKDNENGGLTVIVRFPAIYHNGG